MTVPIISSIGELAEAYEGFIVDLWGVVHGGIAPYPGVVDALLRLRAQAKPLALLSNAPRRAAVVVARLAEMGLAQGVHFDLVMTSGEATREALAERTDPLHAGLGERVLLIGPAWDSSLLDGLGLRPVESVEAADFLLAVGLFDAHEPLSAYDPLFGAALARALPLICANPDLVVQRQNGAEEPCAGMLARIYEERGGRVARHGKPDPGIFHRTLRAMGLAEGGRVLVVGDGLPTDIAGAAAAGLDSLFVTRGIHAVELGITPGAAPAPERLAALLARHGLRPRAAIPTFRW